MEEQNPITVMKERRARKVISHLQQYAPVWMVEEEVFPNEDALQFNVIFYHAEYGWVTRRYRYDAFNDVLYYKGQVMVSEEKALELDDQPPYISAEAVNTVNSYGG